MDKWRDFQIERILIRLEGITTKSPNCNIFIFLIITTIGEGGFELRFFIKETNQGSWSNHNIMSKKKYGLHPKIQKWAVRLRKKKSNQLPLKPNTFN
jgi:hypothetical protein